MPQEHRWFVVLVAVLLGGAPSWAQSSRPVGRVSFYVTSTRRPSGESETRSAIELATAVTFRTPEADSSGFETGLDLRHTRYGSDARPQRVSLYEGFVGARIGSRGQLRVRGGHLWLPDLGTAGALAGGLAEYRTGSTGAERRLSAGVFMGGEPLGYEPGYASDVRKYGGYAALESGFLRRHVVGYAAIKQGGVTQRSLLTVTNYIPAGRSFFAYQALEYDLEGPANGTAKSGLSYFLLNARGSAGSRLELQGTFSRGRSLDARTLTDDVLNGRPLAPLAVDGLRYQTAGGRVTARVVRGLEIYGGYARDRDNRDDRPTARVTIGGYATNPFNSGLDVSGSDATIDRPTGPYHSRYLSIGRAVTRGVYVSGDYSTSLAVIRFVRSDGVRIESRPRTRRLSGNVSATLNRYWSAIGVVDFTTDEAVGDLRIMTGLTYRLR